MPITDNSDKAGNTDKAGRPVRLAITVVLALVAFGVAVGLVVSYLSTTALKAAGIDGSTSDAVTATQEPVISPTQRPGTAAAPSHGGQKTAPKTVQKTAPKTVQKSTQKATPEPEKKDPQKKRKKKPQEKPSPDPKKPSRQGPGQLPGTLRVNDGRVPAFKQVRLRGRIPGVRPGRRVQVERLEAGRWRRFPVTARAEARGEFSVRVALGHPGANVLRVRLPGTRRLTGQATVTVR